MRYEVARSVVKGKGLLTSYIDGFKNDKGEISVRGADPLAQMGVYRTANGIFCGMNGSKWIRYDDYTLAIPEKDLWFDAPKTTSVIQLSSCCLSYDFSTQDGRSNIGGWIEAAAGLAGNRGVFPKVASIEAIIQISG